MHATGTFKVNVKPTEVSPVGKEAGLGVMTIDKTWSGAIEGTSKGQMTTSVTGKAMAYVALESMKVKVDGHSGTFVFMHSATMMSDDPQAAMLNVTVVPNSGTGDLAGIEGKLKIMIDKTGHSYDFEYTMPAR
ncbi:Protein of unknown function (DUF3224) [Terriglobus roseus DSM 18391]|uniref:DUF3224 domain-containing protein n=2 Tax=Terriglobus roseus TaxID=392734 RepID=I3ZEQ4_TERRK|nr:Protein of unknown function (DUF3224) [Terriglobus roseus DSM 18391]